MRSLPASVVGVLILPVVLIAQSAPADVAYPEGYRNWVHVKSALVSPAHTSYATNGGFHHIYGNADAMTGYRSRTFPEGSIIVFDWLAMQDTNGAFAEGPRRQVDVMVKDSRRFSGTGGWGFQRFVKDNQI